MIVCIDPVDAVPNRLHREFRKQPTGIASAYLLHVQEEDASEQLIVKNYYT